MLLWKLYGFIKTEREGGSVRKTERKGERQREGEGMSVRKTEREGV